jgi:hypothetical protein
MKPFLMIQRELNEIRGETAKWSKGEKNPVKRLLDAERVAGELKTVMDKIHQTNERFLVCSLVSSQRTLC